MTRTGIPVKYKTTDSGSHVSDGIRLGSGRLASRIPSLRGPRTPHHFDPPQYEGPVPDWFLLAFLWIGSLRFSCTTSRPVEVHGGRSTTPGLSPRLVSHVDCRLRSILQAPVRIETYRF